MLDEFLAQTAVLHHHVCPRIVLGVRMGMWAGELLGIELPQTKKRLLTIVETDGCFADGVAVSTNCWVGRRTMRVEDYGKVAATFIDTQTEQAWRLSAHPQARQFAPTYAPKARNRWEAMLLGYQRMERALLLTSQPVHLTQSVGEIISRAGYRVICSSCQEEIINQREVHQNGVPLCRSCAGKSYYRFHSPTRTPALKTE